MGQQPRLVVECRIVKVENFGEKIMSGRFSTLRGKKMTTEKKILLRRKIDEFFTLKI